MTEETTNKDTEKVEEENKPKKRGRKPKQKGYFVEEQEKAFRDFLRCGNELERNRLFEQKIYPALCKMIECLIRRYYLFAVDETYEDTFYDTLSFLMTKIHNFDPEKKCKAYSYCGTVCKNYLILRRTQSIKRRDRFLSYDVLFPNSDKDTRVSDEPVVHDTFNNKLIRQTMNEINGILSLGCTEKRELTENEKKLGNALLVILEHWEDMIDNSSSRKLNKMSMLYFIKEYTLCNTTEVRNAMKIYKNTYLFTKEDLIKEWL